MKNFKRTLLCATLGLGLGLSVSTAHAFLVYDAVRTAEFAVQGVQRMLSLISEYHKVHSKEEELKIWEGKKQVKEKDLLKGSSYAFLKDANIMAMGSDKYLPAFEKAEDADRYIREKFFFDPNLSNVTEAHKNEIMQRRYAYVEALAKEILSLSAAIRHSVAQEQSVLKDAETTAGGNIHQIDMMIQTKKTMVELEGANIILQAKLMELEAARMLLGLDPQRIEDPGQGQQ